MNRLKELGKRVKKELGFYRRVAGHPRTPKAARRLLLTACAYAVMPFDLIPDGIPVLGHLDDAVIVPGLIWLALRSVPKDVLEECRAEPDEPAK